MSFQFLTLLIKEEERRAVSVKRDVKTQSRDQGREAEKLQATLLQMRPPPPHQKALTTVASEV